MNQIRDLYKFILFLKKWQLTSYLSVSSWTNNAKCGKKQWKDTLFEINFYAWEDILIAFCGGSCLHFNLSWFYKQQVRIGNRKSYVVCIYWKIYLQYIWTKSIEWLELLRQVRMWLMFIKPWQMLLWTWFKLNYNMLPPILQFHRKSTKNFRLMS